MDQIDQQKNLQKLTQIIKSSNSFKKAAKLLLSVSLFSFLFSYYSLYSFFLHSMNSHFTSPFSFNKNCVFLIFNGILVFIAKTSGSLQSRSGFDLNDHRLIKSIEDGLQMATESSGSESSLLEKEVDSLEKGIEDHDEDQYYFIKDHRLSDDQLKVENEEQDGKYCGSQFDDDEEAGEEENGRAFINGNGEKEIESKSGNCLYDDDEEETNIGVLSTEELNKKFDEFIRRMKEEIRIEAQRTLIMV